MKSIITKHDSSQPVADAAVYLFDDWFDPIEATWLIVLRGGTLDRTHCADRDDRGQQRRSK